MDRTADEEWSLDDMEGKLFNPSNSNNRFFFSLAHIEENLQDQFVQEALTQVNLQSILTIIRKRYFHCRISISSNIPNRYKKNYKYMKKHSYKIVNISTNNKTMIEFDCSSY
jgi:hypothetical protein